MLSFRFKQTPALWRPSVKGFQKPFHFEPLFPKVGDDQGEEGLGPVNNAFDQALTGTGQKICRTKDDEAQGGCHDQN
jgi:hypothetical protein